MSSQISDHSIALGTHLGRSDEATDQQYSEAIALAVASGCRLIDTAPNYRAGRSERVVGAVCGRISKARGVAAEPLIVTKAGFAPPATDEAPVRSVFDRLKKRGEVVGVNALDPAYVRASLAWSRANLAPATCAFVLLHNPELHVPRLGRAFYERVVECFSTLEEERSAGRLLGYGISTWNGLRVDREHPEYIDLSALVNVSAKRGAAGFKLIQLPFNMAQTEALTVQNQGGARTPITTLTLAAEVGLQVMASNPLHQGLLATLPPDVREALPGYPSDASRALQFVRSTPGITTTVVGMKDVQHVRANFALCAFRPLSSREYAQFSE